MRPTLFIGGIRSGKSSLALRWGTMQGEHRLFVATCIPEDAEMRERVRRHKAERGTAWGCIEEGLDIKDAVAAYVRDHIPPPDVVVIDCVSLWIAAMLSRNWDEARILGNVESLASHILSMNAAVGLVSIEAGQGLASVTALGRKFQDALGAANQLLAQHCATVALVHCGLPLMLKGNLPEALL